LLTADGFIAHKKANKSMSTIPPTLGQKSIVRPVSFRFGGNESSIGSVSVRLCTSKPRIAMLRMPMRMLRVWIVVIINEGVMLPCVNDRTPDDSA
jgi:hypothetical protein